MLSAIRVSSKNLRTVAKKIPTASFVRFNSTEAAAAPEAPKAPVDPKITNIVNEIAKLNLLETSCLISELKSTLNIPDISFPVGGAAAPGAAAPGAAAEEAEQKEKPEEKTIFNIKLESFDAKTKPKIIKEVKGLLELSLVESKKIVEAAPKVLKENVSKEEAEKIKKALEAVGGKVTLE